MIPHAVARVARHLIVFWVALTIAFALPRLAPGGPLDTLLGIDAASLTPAARERVLAQFGLDRSVVVQYADYVAGIARGNLGISARSGRPVALVVAERLGWTLALALPALVLSTVLGVLVGALAAWRRGSRLDTSVVLLSVALASIPGFVVGMAAIVVFAVLLRWFPSISVLPASSGGSSPVAFAGQIVLPVATLVIGLVGGVILNARAAVVTTLGEEFLRLAAANGLSPRSVLFRHALRNALLPIVTNLGLTLGALLSGAVVVETVFSVPGLGSLVYQSLLARDYPSLQGAFLVMVAGVIVANLLADLAMPVLDPRIRGGRGASSSRASGVPDAGLAD